jgi:hypothetical protein
VRAIRPILLSLSLLLLAVSTDGGAAPHFKPVKGAIPGWYDTTTTTLFHGTRRDFGHDMGWNLNANGTRFDNTDAAVGDQWESYYEQDATRTWLERHFIYIDTNGSYYRPLSFQMGRTGGTSTVGGIVNGYIAATSFQFYDGNGPSNANPGNSFFRFASTTPAPAAAGWLEVQANATIRKLDNNTAFLYQANAAGTNSLRVAYVDSSDKVEIGVGASAGGDAAGVVIGGAAASNSIPGSSLSLDSGGNQWILQFGVLRPAVNFNGGVGAASFMPGSIYSMQYGSKTQTVSPAASVTLDPGSGGEHFRIALSATAISTVSVATGIPGERITVEVVEDATGTRTIPSTWTNVSFAGGSYSRTATANQRDVLTLVYDNISAKWYEASRAMAIPN